ncbi:MAG: ribosome small subunit-dependent GTPase A [Photobacterium frigidiphilum]|uniref:ribosome small subunit-dependent GTPase A n=1 Tax=Photobacterium frigidiphilum TaxID=264736 RepID=UPI0030014A35
MNSTLSLPQLGWHAYFQQQLSLEELETCQIGRVLAHHRSLYVIQTETGSFSLEIRPSMPALTVGDWILLDSEQQLVRLLDRLTLLSRKAAGSKVSEQLIAANVDTLFIVNSLNQDFNLSRIERYLAIAHDSGCEPVIILTKADCCDTPESFKQQVQTLDPFLMVEAVNSLDTDSVEALKSWCKVGKTVAFVGSSGVGKSTLVNTLMQSQDQETGGVREDDSKGRHTTTSRSMHIMPTGALLLDTPGIRELQIADCEQGIEETFNDIAKLSQQCRFADCQHQAEPKCAVQKAMSTGQLDERRLNNYFKLRREQERNGSSIAEMRSKNKNLSKMYKSVQTSARENKGK